MESTDDHWLPSRVVLAWVTPLAIRGFRRALKAENLPAGPRWYSASNIREKIEEAWAAEQAKIRCTSTPSASIWRGLIRPLGGTLFLQGAALETLSGVLAGFGRPFVLQHALRSLDASQGYTLEAGIGLACGLAAITWLENWSRYQGGFVFADLGAYR